MKKLLLILLLLPTLTYADEKTDIQQGIQVAATQVGELEIKAKQSGAVLQIMQTLEKIAKKVDALKLEKPKEEKKRTAENEQEDM